MPCNIPEINIEINILPVYLRLLFFGCSIKLCCAAFILQEVDRLQQRLAEMNAKETANGNLQSKIKVGSLFRSSSMSKRIKVR